MNFIKRKKREREILGPFIEPKTVDIKKIISIILIFILIGLFSYNLIKKPEKNEVVVINLPPNEKIETGKYLVFINSVTVKSLQEAEKLKEAIEKYQNADISYETLTQYIIDANKTFTFLYMTNLTLEEKEKFDKIPKNFKYSLYLLRRASEELLKFIDDKSTLRLEVGKNLIDMAKMVQKNTIQNIITKLTQYQIDPAKVSIDQLIWEKLEKYKEETQEELIVFEDIETEKQYKYSQYIQTVNDGLFLVSWELEQIYKYKNDFEQGNLTKKQLDRKIEDAQYTIAIISEQIKYLTPPENFIETHKEILEAFSKYSDGIKEIQKFSMTGKIEYFEEGIKIFKLGDKKANKALQFIGALRNKFGF